MSSPLVKRALRRLAAVAALALALVVVPVPRMEITSVAVAAIEEPTQVLPADEEAAQEVAAVADEPVTGERVVARGAGVEEFSTIGITFDSQPEGPVFVRVLDPEGVPGEWRELHVDPDEGPDGGSGVPGTEPMWVGEASGYEVNLAAADAGIADVTVVRDEMRRSVVDATPLADAAEPPFGVNSRSAWGARAANSSASYGSTVRLAVVHHSDGSNDYSPGAVPGIIRSIQAFHMDGRGWSDIAYNFVVDKYGGLWEGRGGGIDRPVVGAHAMGFNTNSVGVMVLGDYTSATPTGAAIESVSKVIGWKLALHDADPSGRVAFTSGGSTTIPAGVTVDLPRVVGHRDVGATSCPGSIHGSLGQIRNRAQEWTNWVRLTSAPLGNLDRVVPYVGGLTVIGWALDADTTAPIDVSVVVDGVARPARADQPRPDVEAQYPGSGANHGFWVDVGGLSPGWHDVCVIAWNVGFGNNATIGCAGAVVPDPTGQRPVGAIDSLGVIAGGIDVGGWATDAGAPAAVVLTVDGEWRRTLPAGAGGRFGARLLGIRGGVRHLCAVGVNVGPGADTRVQCASVAVPGSNPIGRLDGIGLQGRVITTSGWALDPEQLGPIEVSLVIDGRWHSTWAAGRRTDWLSQYPGYGDEHGFAFGVPASPGRHRVCVVAGNVGSGAATTFTCDDVVVK